MIKPLAKKYVNQENINAIFDNLTSGVQLNQGEKAIILLNRTAGGTVAAGTYALDGKTIRRQFEIMSVEDLILSFFK